MTGRRDAPEGRLEAPARSGPVPSLPPPAHRPLRRTPRGSPPGSPPRRPRTARHPRPPLPRRYRGRPAVARRSCRGLCRGIQGWLQAAEQDAGPSCGAPFRRRAVPGRLRRGVTARSSDRAGGALPLEPEDRDSHFVEEAVRSISSCRSSTSASSTAPASALKPARCSRIRSGEKSPSGRRAWSHPRRSQRRDRQCQRRSR